MIGTLICGTALLLIAVSPGIATHHRHVQAMQQQLQMDKKIIADYQAQPKIKNPIMVIDGVPVVKLDHNATNAQPKPKG